jgi:hypothetical protein
MRPDAEHRQPVVGREAAELALNGGATAIEGAPHLGLARDARLAVTAVLPQRDDRYHVPLDFLARRAARQRSGSSNENPTRPSS